MRDQDGRLNLAGIRPYPENHNCDHARFFASRLGIGLRLRLFCRQYVPKGGFVGKITISQLPSIRIGLDSAVRKRNNSAPPDL
jgi:hypothetical protein